MDSLTVNSGGWRLFAQFIGSSFLFISGLSFWLFWIYSKNQKRFLNRLGKLFAASILVTIGSFIAYGEYFIFFGILHLLAVCTLLALLLVRMPSVFLLVLSLFILFFTNYFSFEVCESRLCYWIGLYSGYIGTVDFYPFFPWAAPYIFGLAFGKAFYRYPHQCDENSDIQKGILENKSQYNFVFNVAKKGLLFLSSYALYIYLIHQPVFFGLIILALNFI